MLRYPHIVSIWWKIIACTRCAIKGGRERSNRWENIFHWCVCKIIMDPGLYPSPVTHPTGIWDTRSTDHGGVCPRDCDFDPTVKPATYVWNRFHEFFCHEPTQIREYKEGLLLVHAIKGFTEIGYVPKSRVIFKKNRWCPFCFFFVL